MNMAEERKMGMDQEKYGAWEKIREIAKRLESPHEDKIFVAKDYTKKQLREDLLKSIGEGSTA